MWLLQTAEERRRWREGSREKHKQVVQREQMSEVYDERGREGGDEEQP